MIHCVCGAAALPTAVDDVDAHARRGALPQRLQVAAFLNISAVRSTFSFVLAVARLQAEERRGMHVSRFAHSSPDASVPASSDTRRSIVSSPCLLPQPLRSLQVPWCTCTVSTAFPLNGPAYISLSPTLSEPSHTSPTSHAQHQPRTSSVKILSAAANQTVPQPLRRLLQPPVIAQRKGPLV